MSSKNAAVEKIIRDYLERYLEGSKVGDAWKLADSQVSGRALRATRDIQSGEIIFWDRPLVLGPRSVGTAVCVGCHLESENLQGCPRGCKLPVCKPECAESQTHQFECTLLAANGSCHPDGGSWSTGLLQSVAAIRCLQMNEDDRQVVRCLQANSDATYGRQIEVIKSHLGENLSLEDEQWMSLCCRSMNTNAFETLKRGKLDDEGREGTLRGLYPTGALLNHSCLPNTSHVYDENCNMIVFASKFIPNGEEITTIYCSLLWDTSSRRLHLAKTKQFGCSCERCKDPSEFGTNLSGLPCPQAPCSGVILCSNPLLPHRSLWICTDCSAEIQMDEVMKLQRVQGLLLMSTNSSNPQSILNLLDSKQVPSNCVVAVQLKLGLCLQLGHTEGYRWEDLSEDQLQVKITACNDLIKLLERLRSGQTRLKGIITFELHSSLCEELRRLTQDNNNENDESHNKTITSLKEEIQKTFKVVSDIFEKDATAPLQFLKKLRGPNLYENYN